MLSPSAPKFALFRGGMWFGYAESVAAAHRAIRADRPFRRAGRLTRYAIRAQRSRFKRVMWRRS
jgi:hypothetical protein